MDGLLLERRQGHLRVRSSSTRGCHLSTLHPLPHGDRWASLARAKGFWVDRWIDELLGLGKSARTAYIYARLIGQAEKFLERRGKTLADCGPADVAAMAETVRKSHSSRGQLRAALAAAWEILGRQDGPLKAVRVPPKPRGRCRALEPDQAALLEREAWNRGDDPGLAVLLGLYAALRRAEIARLRWEDIDVDAAGRPVLVRVMGKGDRMRNIPVHPVLAVALARRRRPIGWVFESPRGGPVNPESVWRWTRSIAADAGLSLSTHVLRHTSLAEANDRSGNLRTVQDFAGHSRPEITSLYTRTTWAELLRVVSLIDYGRHLDGQEEVLAS